MDLWKYYSLELAIGYGKYESFFGDEYLSFKIICYGNVYVWIISSAARILQILFSWIGN